VTKQLRPELTTGSNERAFFCSYDSRLGWRNQPEAEGTFFKTRIRHNAYGQRDNVRDPQRSGPGPRVMVLGDSFVWGYRIEAPDRFSDRLEALMPGSEMLNFGCSGYGQDQEYLLLEEEIRRWHPGRVVVGVHVASDLDNNLYSLQYGYYKPVFDIAGDELVLRNVPVPQSSPGTRIDRWLTARSALWNLVGSRSIVDGTVRTRIVNALNALSPGSPAKVFRSRTPRVELTCRLCAAIDELAKANGADAVFLLIPDIDVHDQSLRRSEDYRALRTCLSQRALPTLDLAPVFRRYHASHPHAWLTLAGDRHWSVTGNAVVARALHAYFRNHPAPR